MSILSHHVSFDQFDLATDFYPPVTDYSALDHADRLGYDAASEAIDWEEVFPPAELSIAEAAAFRSGARRRFMELEWELEQSRTPMCDEDADDMYDSWVREREARDAFIGQADECW